MNSLTKKLLIGTAIAAPAFLMSYSPEQPDEARVSEEAPNIEIAAGDSVFSLKNLRGKDVVLQFWSKYDPQSRIDNLFNSHKYQENKDVVYVAVCVDNRDEELSRMIVAEDGINSSQYYRSQLTPASRLSAYTISGNGCWHISKEGIIISRG